MGLKAWSSRGQLAWPGMSPEGIRAHGEKAGQNAHRHTVWKQWSEEHLGHTMGRCSVYPGAWPETQHSRRDPSKNKETSTQCFSPSPLSINTEPVRTSRAYIPCLTCLHHHPRYPPLNSTTTTPAPAIQWNHLLVIFVSVPDSCAPSPSRPAQLPVHTMSPNQGVLQGLSSTDSGNRSHF